MSLHQFFPAFVQKWQANFRRIAYATKREMLVEELHSDAWIVAHEIGTKRGREIDFSDPDEELVMSAVNARNVKRGDWNFRKAVRIDRETDGDDGSRKWSERLPAQASSAPLIALLQHESALESEALLASSYSQAAAYVMVFIHFNNSRREVCAYLVISGDTLARRVAAAAATVRIQASLFDGVEQLDKQFLPLPGRPYSVRLFMDRTTDQ